MYDEYGSSFEPSRKTGRTVYFSLAAVVAAFATMSQVAPGFTQDSDRSPCTEDAMLVFDASGSMSGDGWDDGSESAHTVSRIDRVRYALSKVLPSITRFRRVGLVTYGPTQTPGLFNQCDNIKVNLPPTPDSATRIMATVKSLVPAGGTPLTRAVEHAAEILHFERKPGVIVLLTDGEDTCGGSPCHVGKQLHAAAAQLTVHVIGLRVKGLSWTGEANIIRTQCLAEHNGGLYLTPENTDDLIDALEKTLGCPKVSKSERSTLGQKADIPSVSSDVR